jgi:hypothetical protein
VLRGAEGSRSAMSSPSCIAVANEVFPALESFLR